MADGGQRITLFNPAAERMFGYRAEEILGQPLDRLMPERFRAGHGDLLGRFSGAARIGDGRREVIALAADGREFPAEISISKETGREGELLTAVVRDITERQRFEDELRRLATTDSLTGLPNRRHFLETAGRELARMRRSGDPATVLMLDIDHFKRINDALGHAAGDEALRAVADACRRVLRESDLAGRLGGEELGVLLPGTDLPSALDVAERLRVAMAGISFAGGGGLTVSIGASACVAADASIEQALGRADHALYRAKETGRDRVEVE